MLQSPYHLTDFPIQNSSNDELGTSIVVKSTLTTIANLLLANTENNSEQSRI